MNTNQNVVDPRALDMYTGGDADAAREIYAEFLHTCEVDLETARGARTAEVLCRAAHRIKGASHMIGAMPLREAADLVERHALRGDWQSAVAGLPGLEHAYRELSTALDALTAA